MLHATNRNNATRGNAYKLNHQGNQKEKNEDEEDFDVPIISKYENMQSTDPTDPDEEEPDVNSSSTRQFVDKSRARIPSDAKYIINPKSSFQINWDVLMMVLLIYTAIVTPFETGFVETKFNFLFGLNRIVDVLFLCDLFLQFFTPFYSNETGGWVINHKRIAKHYLTGWFSIDFVSILPFDTLGAVMQNEAIQQLKILRAIRLLRLAKLLRIFKGSRIIKRLQSRIGISYGMQTMIKFIVMILTAAHWLACAWGIILGLEDHRDRIGEPKNWATEHRADGIPGGIFAVLKDDPFQVYLAGLYWAVMTVTTIGYGDIVPVTVGEQFLCVIAMLLGASTYAYVIGTVCGVIALMDQATSKFNQQMDELNLYMEENQMPNEMRVRLREYFNYCKQMNRQKYYQALLVEMSPTLRGEVASYINSAWLDKVPFFNPAGVTKEESKTFCVEVSMKLLPEAFAPQELIIRMGEPTEKMYMVQRGVVAMKGQIISSGRLIGDDFVMHNAKRDYNVRSITYCDVFTLTKRDLEEIFDRNELPKIKPRVRRYAIQTAFRKALVAYSQGKWKMPPMIPVKRSAYMQLGEVDEERTLEKAGLAGVNARPNAARLHTPPETAGERKHTEDVIQEAEQELAMSQEVTSPKPRRSPVKARASPMAESPSPKRRHKINTSVSGSAAKVLQLMEDRHRALADTTEKILKRQMKFDNDLDVKIKRLVETQESSEKKVLLLGAVVAGVAFVTFVLVIVLLVGGNNNSSSS
jgi:hypothetical protein